MTGTTLCSRKQVEGLTSAKSSPAAQLEKWASFRCTQGEVILKSVQEAASSFTCRVWIHVPGEPSTELRKLLCFCEEVQLLHRSKECKKAYHSLATRDKWLYVKQPRCTEWIWKFFVTPKTSKPSLPVIQSVFTVNLQSKSNGVTTLEKASRTEGKKRNDLLRPPFF